MNEQIFAAIPKNFLNVFAKKTCKKQQRVLIII